MMGRPTKRPSDWERIIRDRHAQGQTDEEIGRQMGISRGHLSHLRRRIGLASNAHHPRQRRKVAAKTREQCEQAGVESLAEIRVLAFRKFAQDLGWPADLRPRAVMILEALRRRGPMTRRELAEEIGMPWKGSRKSLHSEDPGGSYLAHLMTRGLVVCLGRIEKGKGSGTSVCRYALALDAVPTPRTND